MPPTTSTGRPGGQVLGRQPRRGLGRGDDLVRPGRHAEPGELRRDRRGRAGGVVGHEREPHAGRGRLGQRVGGTRDGGTAEVNDPVEVEQGHVVQRGERLTAPCSGMAPRAACRDRAASSRTTGGGRLRRGVSLARQRVVGWRRDTARRRVSRHGRPGQRGSSPSGGGRARCPGSGLRPCRQRRPDAAQRLGVVGQLRPHGGGEGEVFRGGGRIPAAGEGKAEAEVSVVVTRDCLHVLPEVVRRLRVPAGIELCPGQGLTDAAGARLRRRGTFEQLGGRGGASPAQQVEPPTVPRVAVAPRTLLTAVGSSRAPGPAPLPGRPVTVNVSLVPLEGPRCHVQPPGRRAARIPGVRRSPGPLADAGLGIFAGTGIVAAVRCF